MDQAQLGIQVIEVEHQGRGAGTGKVRAPLGLDQAIAGAVLHAPQHAHEPFGHALGTQEPGGDGFFALRAAEEYEGAVLLLGHLFGVLDNAPGMNLGPRHEVHAFDPQRVVHELAHPLGVTQLPQVTLANNPVKTTEREGNLVVILTEENVVFVHGVLLHNEGNLCESGTPCLCKSLFGSGDSQLR